MSVSTGREVLEKREKRIGRWDEATGHHRREHPPTPQCPNEPPSRGDSPLPGIQRGRQALLLHPRRIPLPQGLGSGSIGDFFCGYLTDEVWHYRAYQG